MEQSFSQRMGFKSTENAFQLNSMNDDLRNGLWNDYVQFMKGGLNSYAYWELACKLWSLYFKLPIDDVPLGDNYDRAKKLHPFIKERFFKFEWYEVYDFIEFIVKNAEDFHIAYAVDKFVAECNNTLIKELSAYRFVGNTFAPITSEQEIVDAVQALDFTRPFTPHLEKALTLLANRTSPDYANSMKESICAVEAMCQLIVGNQKATLGEALGQLESKLGSVHPALRRAFSSLYGYTNDAQGIRHALLGESDLDVEDANFMLSACSAFINYLATKAGKAGIELSQS